MQRPRTTPAVGADLSQYLRIVVYGNGDVMMLRSGREPMSLTSREIDRLVLVRDEFLKRVRTEET